MEWIEKNIILCLGVVDRIFPPSWNNRDRSEELKGKTDLVKIYKIDYKNPVSHCKGGEKIEVYYNYRIIYNIHSFPNQEISSVKVKNDNFEDSYWRSYVVDATLEDAKRLAVSTIKKYTKELNSRI